MLKIDTPTIRKLRDRLLADRALAPVEISLRARNTLSQGQQAALERISPLAEVLFLTMAADWDLARSESRAIHNAVALLTGDLLLDAEVGDLLGHFQELLATQGRDTRLEALASCFCLEKRDAEAAFDLAAAVALCDGVVTASESALIEDLRRYFGIPEARASALLDGAPTLR